MRLHIWFTRTKSLFRRIKPLFWLSAVVFAGCVLPPPKEAPHPRQLANDNVGLTGVAAEPAADGWWDSFQDPQLDRLIRLGAKDSPTLAQANTRVSAALAHAQSAQAGFRPRVNLHATALYQPAPHHYLIPPPLHRQSFCMG